MCALFLAFVPISLCLPLCRHLSLSQFLFCFYFGFAVYVDLFFLFILSRFQLKLLLFRQRFISTSRLWHTVKGMMCGEATRILLHYYKAHFLFSLYTANHLFSHLALCVLLFCSLCFFFWRRSLFIFCFFLFIIFRFYLFCVFFISS